MSMAGTSDELRTFSGRSEWRGWLAQHHSTENEAWVVILKKGAAVAGVPYEDAVEEALCYGWIDGKMHGIDRDCYALRFSPRRARSLWSLSNRERAEALTERGLMTEAGLEKIEEARRNGRWDEAYSSRSAPDVPREVKDALSADPAVWTAFDAMTNSDKLRYMVWVKSAKQEKTRQRRIQELIRLMRDRGGS